MAVPDSEAQPILDAFFACGGWELGNFTFASGQTANNKLDMEKLLVHRTRRKKVIVPLTDNVVEHSPQAVWGVPRGGQMAARHVANLLGIGFIQLRKDSKHHVPGAKNFIFANPESEALARDCDRLVGIEDVTTEMTSLCGALQLPLLDEHTLAIESIWRRGGEGVERPIDKPMRWLIERPLPNHITIYHPFYREFHDRAVGSLPEPGEI